MRRPERRFRILCRTTRLNVPIRLMAGLIVVVRRVWMGLVPGVLAMRMAQPKRTAGCAVWGGARQSAIMAGYCARALGELL